MKNGLTATCKAAVPESVKTKGRVMVEERQTEQQRGKDAVMEAAGGGQSSKEEKTL